MSLLERRLQILLDQHRYDLVAAEARRTGQSVAAVIRDAIDLRLEDGRDANRRAVAARRLLASADPGPGAGESWAQMRAAQEAALERRYPTR